MKNLKEISEYELINLIKCDDFSAFAELYNRYKGPLYIHAFHRLKNREEVKDLIQELFATIWANRQTLVLKSNLSGYLYKAVRNKVFKIIAHKQVNSLYLESIENYIHAGECITDHLIREKEFAKVIEQEIAALPPKMQEVFNLSRKVKLSHKEIALQLDLSEKTVRNQINNALKVLRVKLGVSGIILILMLCFK